MGTFLLLAIVLYPVLEVTVLIRLGQHFGIWNTVALLLAMGLAGSALARFEGMRALVNIQSALARGEMPAEPALDALMVFAAGVLLVIPGFLSDVAAIVLLVPFTRYAVKRGMRLWFDAAMRRSKGSGGGFNARFLIR